MEDTYTMPKSSSFIGATRASLDTSQRCVLQVRTFLEAAKFSSVQGGIQWESCHIRAHAIPLFRSCCLAGGANLSLLRSCISVKHDGCRVLASMQAKRGICHCLCYDYLTTRPSMYQMPAAQGWGGEEHQLYTMPARSSKSCRTLGQRWWTSSPQIKRGTGRKQLFNLVCSWKAGYTLWKTCLKPTPWAKL